MFSDSKYLKIASISFQVWLQYSTYLLLNIKHFSYLANNFIFEIFAVPSQKNDSRSNFGTTPDSQNQIFQQGSYSLSQHPQPLQISTESQQSKVI